MLKLPSKIDKHLLLNLILRFSPSYIVIIDKTYKIIFLNRALNTHPSEFIGKHIADDAHPEDKESFMECVKQAFAVDHPIPFMCRSKWGHSFMGKMIPFGDYVLDIVWQIDGGMQKLTRRELEIKALVDSGLSSKAIAERLNISKHTVDNHRKKIKRVS